MATQVIFFGAQEKVMAAAINRKSNFFIAVQFYGLKLLQIGYGT
jgi:hypothetical protein